MKTLIKRSAIFLLMLPLFHVASYSLLNRGFELLRHRNNTNAIYVWGDSRTYRCVDVKALKSNLGREVYGYGSAGAGIYSFYVFAQTVPEKSTVILGPSLRMFVVDPARENNESALSLRALLLSAQNGYPLGELYDIYNLNHIPWESAFYRTNPAPYENSDVPLQSNLDWFKVNYGEANTFPDHYIGKMKIFNAALDLLIEKECRVFLIEMPVSEQLLQIREASIFRNFSTELHDYNEHPLLHVITDWRPPTDSNYFYDLHHLNERGRDWITGKLTELLGNEDRYFESPDHP